MFSEFRTIKKPMHTSKKCASFWMLYMGTRPTMGRKLYACTENCIATKLHFDLAKNDVLVEGSNLLIDKM